MWENIHINIGPAAILGRFTLPFIFVLAISTGQAMAAATSWTGPQTGGVFNDDDNWSLNSPGDNTPPPNGPNDNATIGSNGTINGTITFDANATHNITTIQNSTGTLAFDVGAFKWTMSSFFLAGDDLTSNNTIRLIGGNVQSSFILLGNSEFSSDNSIEVTGAGTVWHYTFTGASVRVGSLGADNSTFTIHNGGKVTTLGQTIIGLAGSSNGRLFVTDTGVLETANYLATGHTSNADSGKLAVNNEAHILDGGTVRASNLYMAITVGAPDNEIIVSGAGSKVTLTGVNNNDGTASHIGWRDVDNTLRIENGGVVEGTNRFILGVEATSTNNQILLNNGSLSGTEIEIKQQSNVSVTNGTIDLIQYLNEAPDPPVYQGGGIVAETPTSTFTFNSGTVRSVNANIANGSAFTVGNGSGTPATYHMRKDQAGNRGTHTFTNGLALASNGILSGDGNITGNVSGSAGAKVQVGASPGLVNVTGDWNNTGIGISLELDNLATSIVPGVQFDQLNITGQFTHGGTVTIDRSELVTPASSQQLKLVGWGSESGLSTSTVVSFLGGSPLTYNFLSDGLYVTVQASAGTPGDYNNNGFVDAADYVVWKDNEGTNNPLPNNTIAGPIGQLHYNQWRANFGKPPGSGAGLAESANLAVPEPTAWILWLGMAVAGTLIRRAT
jgi:hypothetical protein